MDSRLVGDGPGWPHGSHPRGANSGGKLGNPSRASGVQPYRVPRAQLLYSLWSFIRLHPWMTRPIMAGCRRETYRCKTAHLVHLRALEMAPVFHQVDINGINDPFSSCLAARTSRPSPILLVRTRTGCSCYVGPLSIPRNNNTTHAARYPLSHHHIVKSIH
jgi:hypothetical protein